MKEKDFQVLFKHHIANNPPEHASVYELKFQSDAKPMHFDRVDDHQVAGLRQAKNKGLYHKIADQPPVFIKGRGRMYFGSKKPFDCVFLRDMKAYVVILYYRPREIKRAIMIEIDDFIKEKETSERRSLTEERAKEIATYVRVLD